MAEALTLGSTAGVFGKLFASGVCGVWVWGASVWLAHAEGRLREREGALTRATSASRSQAPALASHAEGLSRVASS